MIELLIVVAIIAILMMLLAPSLGGVRHVVRRIQCGSNMHQLVLGWGRYTQNNSQMIPSSDTGSWVGSWVDADHNPYTKEGATNGSIYKYVGAWELYKCLDFPYEYFITYGANSYLNGQHSGASYRPGTIYKFDKIQNPGHTFWLAEEWDNRGWIMGSFAPFHFGPYHWWDVVAGNHNLGDNITFVDGHVEYWIWQDKDTLTYYGGHYATDPGSVDCDRLRAAMFGDDIPKPE